MRTIYLTGLKRKLGIGCMLTILVLGFVQTAKAVGPGGTFSSYPYAEGNVRYVEVVGQLTALNPGQSYYGVWIQSYTAHGQPSACGEISLNMNTLQFSGSLGDFQMAYYAVVVGYRQGNGPIQYLYSPIYAW